MSGSARTMCVKFLLQRAGGGWTFEDLAFKTDSEVMDLASERHTDIDQDVTDLKAAGLWPMPEWMIKRGVAQHGIDDMARIRERNTSAKRTTYA